MTTKERGNFMTSSYQPPSEQGEQKWPLLDKPVATKRYIIPSRARVRQRQKKHSNLSPWQPVLDEKQQEPEIEGERIILFRNPNFFVRTTYRPDKQYNQRLHSTGKTAVIAKIRLPQEEHMVACETRLLPRVSPINPPEPRKFLVPAWLEALTVTIGLLISLIAHAFNMFNFPRYELDEGTYISSAWAILQGQITPYPYGYGHPPLAWMQIAAWVQLTGGF